MFCREMTYREYLVACLASTSGTPAGVVERAFQIDAELQKRESALHAEEKEARKAQEIKDRAEEAKIAIKMEQHKKAFIESAVRKLVARNQEFIKADIAHCDAKRGRARTAAEQALKDVEARLTALYKDALTKDMHSGAYGPRGDPGTLTDEAPSHQCNKKVDVKKCSSCGQDHDGLEFRKLISPVLVRGEKYPYVGQCPVTNEQVHIRVSLAGFVTDNGILATGK